MGDRTSVTLYVLDDQAEGAKAVLTDSYGDFNKTQENGINLAAFTFEDVNYWELNFLDDLEEAGIAYDSDWGAGSEYGSGSKTCRFTPEGEIVFKEIYESEYGVNIDTLLDLIDRPDTLRQYILDYKKRLEVLPWDNQEEFSKIYRTRQLITPK